MGSIPPELSLDFRPSATTAAASATTTTTTVSAGSAAEEQGCPYVPKTIAELVGQVSMIGNVEEKLLKLDDYVKKLEDEMRKIDAFKRELPLCMLLLNDAIRTLRDESTKCEKMNSKPVLEEFIPLKRSCNEDHKLEMDVETSKKDKDSREKMSWMSSVQLWNSDNSASKSEIDINEARHSKLETKKRVKEVEIQEELFKPHKNRSVMGAFPPFPGCSVLPIMMSRKENEYELPGVVPGLSLQTPGTKKQEEDIGSRGLNSKVGGIRAVSCSVSSVQSNIRAGVSQQQQQTSRKQRRCWSPELHRRFVDALQKLGGCQAATPKQIRELMQVDGLTNDEVKSHLQKYRLHTRRLPTSTGSSTDPPVVFGGLWLGQDQHGESSKQSNSQSGSPQGPLQLGGASRGTSTTGGDSMEDEEDEKSESHSWKSHILTSQRTNV